jgi:predicted secreted hydrolase
VIRRRALLAAAACGMTCARSAVAEPIGPRALRFPRDFGAHPDARTEWWYVTGALDAGEVTHGFQVTFFRSRTAVPDAHPSRFAARQLVFAHAALSDMAQQRLRHDQRAARAGFGIADASEADTRVHLRDWQLVREGPLDHGVYRTRLASDSGRFAFDLTLATTQPPLLQGREGWSRKGQDAAQASHYYSEPQLQVSGSLTIDDASAAVRGSAWLDHEWSDSLLAAAAVGWDWIGINLFDGAALTAFRLRRADGSTLWAGGSLRVPGGPVRDFAADEVQFTPGRRWRSPASQADYPVEWTIETPAGRHQVRARLDAQELDSRASTGTFYWEGLSDLLDAQGRAVGRGYLEMTGYAGTLRF